MRAVRSRSTLPLLLLAVLCSGSSCGPGKEQPQEAKPQADSSVARHYERGPLLLDLKVSRKEITVAERLTLSLEATVEEGYEVGFPAAGGIGNDFGLVDFTTTPARLLPGGKIALKREYVLEPMLSGDYTIPALKVRFTGKGGESHELETEPVSVKVLSLLPKDMQELEIKDIVGPQSPPARIGWILLAAGALLLVGAGVVLGALSLSKRRRTGEEAARIPAHEIAFDALERLAAGQLVEKGAWKEFYVRLTDILRRYIENRFGFHAPERTTEEFLEEIRRDGQTGGFADALGPARKRLLEEFFTHGDMVKFAAMVPRKEEVQAAFDSCRDFISGTAAEGPA
jgi:hypothetical protein